MYICRYWSGFVNSVLIRFIAPDKTFVKIDHEIMPVLSPFC